MSMLVRDRNAETAVELTHGMVVFFPASAAAAEAADSPKIPRYYLL
jgi:hypothetical protein